MVFGIGSRIKNMFNRGMQDSTSAVRAEDRAAALGRKEEKEEAGVKRELGAFFSSMQREVLLMKDLTALEATKYSLVRALSAFDAAKRNLSVAKKKVFSGISTGGRRIANLTRAQVARGMGQAARGGAAIARGLMVPGQQGPQFDYASWSANVQRFTDANKKHIQLLANELNIQINENRQEAAEANRLIDKNREIREKLHQFDGIISQQNSELDKARKELLAEIRKEMGEYELERYGLRNQLRALGEENLVKPLR